MKCRLAYLLIAVVLVGAMVYTSFAAEGGLLIDECEGDGVVWTPAPNWLTDKPDRLDDRKIEYTAEWSTQGEKSLKLSYVIAQGEGDWYPPEMWSTFEEGLDLREYTMIKIDINNATGRTIETDLDLRTSAEPNRRWSVEVSGNGPGTQSYKFSLKRGIQTYTFVLPNAMWTIASGEWVHEKVTDTSTIEKALSDVKHICLVFRDYGSKGSIMIDNIRLVKGEPEYF